MEEKILLIDDDCAFLEIATRILEQADYQVLTAECPAIAFPILAKEPVDLVLCDLHMPFIIGEFQNDFKTSFETGIQTIKELAWALPDLKIVGISSAPQSDLDRIAGQVFPHALVTNPDRKSDLIKLVRIFLEQAQEESPLYVV
jgi:CheY-like chemotaxis protein